jgi:hypothetical protein
MKDIGLHVLYTPPIVNHERSVSLADNPFKAVFVLSKGPISINLGGHVVAKDVTNGLTEFGIIHYHSTSRCVEIAVENCKRVLERHEFISPLRH